jgi:hypothetical protein
MQPARALWEQISTLLSADTTYLANAAAMKVALVKATFVPGLDTVLANLTLAAFTGSTPLSCGTGTQLVFYDPLTNTRVIEVKAPAGGFHWACTVTPAPAETIYGIALTDNAGAVLIGTMLLPTPITISAAGQGLDVANIRLSFNLNSPN